MGHLLVAVSATGVQPQEPTAKPTTSTSREGLWHLVAMAKSPKSPKILSPTTSPKTSPKIVVESPKKTKKMKEKRKSEDGSHYEASPKKKKKKTKEVEETLQKVGLLKRDP